MGERPTSDYGVLAAETAKAMRLIDPTIELVACGSSGPRMSTFPDWEVTVLDHTYHNVDYIVAFSVRGGSRTPGSHGAID